ncbi:uncharacterized protein LOC135089454 [Scylla paramamosain]|uniref:uncharacterized protein LOC135089454 n=1 Tax=Scylla paramamosain TaxID=85552 RepID=UPI0030839BDF
MGRAPAIFYRAPNSTMSSSQKRCVRFQETKGASVLLLTTAVVACWAAVRGEEVEAVQKDEPKEAVNQKERLFINSRSTTTWTFLSEFTSTVPFTCYTTPAGGANACSGRRLKRSKKLHMKEESLGSKVLYTSQGEGDGAKAMDREDEDEDAADPKLIFTIWRTASTTVTATTFSTNRSEFKSQEGGNTEADREFQSLPEKGMIGPRRGVGIVRVCGSLGAPLWRHNTRFVLQRGFRSLLLVSLLALTAGTQNEEDDEGEAKLIVKNYTTTTWTFLSSLTSTVPYTCYTSAAAGAEACEGRRLRRSKEMKVLDDSLLEGGDVALYSSVGAEDEELEEEERKKLFFRLWKTASTTVTVTTFSTNRSVTVSASIMCTYPGIVLNFLHSKPSLTIQVERSHAYLVYLVVVAVVVAATAAETSTVKEIPKTKMPGRFFLNKAQSTTTWTFLSSFTSTVPYTCYTTASTAGATMECMGRRLRRIRGLRDQDVQVELFPSGPLKEGQQEEEEEAKESDIGKFFTIWRTASTTVTVTTFSTNRSVTISVSAMCTVNGLNINFC